MSTAHGFGNVQAQIARKSGVSMKRAGAILAAGTRRAGSAARKRNPRLNRVKGYSKGGVIKCPRCDKHTATGKPCEHCGGYVPHGYAKGGMVRGYKRGGSVREKPYGTKMCRRDGMTVETPNGD